MMNIDPSTKNFFGADTIERMEEQINLYEEQPKKKKNSYFQHITDRIRSRTIAKDFKQEIVNAYLEEMKKNLLNFEDETMSHNSAKTDKKNIKYYFLTIGNV